MDQTSPFASDELSHLLQAAMTAGESAEPSGSVSGEEEPGLQSDGSQLGARLRTARHRRGLSLAEVARRCGLAKGYLSEIERDLTAPSVATLLRICGVLDLPPASLFEGAQDSLVRAAERRPFVFGGTGLEEYQLTPMGEQRLLVVQSTILPGGGSGDEPYVLPGHVEFVLVLSGLLEIDLGGEPHRLAAGDALTFPSTDKRRWHNPSSVSPTCVLWVMSPAQ
ncbi:helix-turn-helix domain-containing protein [Streptomyces sp. NPDC090075]|uniref:helix-turn-helix domain-containing protein n=1 Tax=Streptomyces sp. NPDC090075 TaxID=3365937 RepID=UPI0038232059